MEAARVAETHSAWVILLGDRAYKVKKPVKLEFLDFSSRAARREAALREVELNRRLAPDVYLGVADLVWGDGEPLEHVIVMRRMPDDRRLSTLVERGEPLGNEVRAIARLVATFHARAETSPMIATAGTPSAVHRKLTDDLEQMREHGDELLDARILEEVATLAQRYLLGRAPLLNARLAANLIRDGHGDLLADDIFCLDDGSRILDCIDFDDRLRYGDVLADVAFLAMDLERLGAAALAAQFVTAYQEFSAERHPQSLIHYYTASRALVRSKVACVRARQGQGSASADARRLLDLATDHLRRGRIRMVLVGGTPGTGKSTLAAGLADELGWAVLRSDELRKDLVGVPHSASRNERFGEGIYSSEMTDATYRALLVQARTLLELGESVILDASWSAASWREAAERCAEETASDIVQLRCDTPPDVAHERIESRSLRDDDVSDATQEVAERMEFAFDDWPDARVIPTGESVETSIATASAAINGRRDSERGRREGR